jgi:ectoine hydroxylase
MSFEGTISRAPRGFSPESWRRFCDDGILIVEDALDPELCGALRVLLDQQTEGCVSHVVERDPLFSEMIDHPAHVGHVYDVYGDMLKLLASQTFVRPPNQEIRNDWHFDGPRMLPFQLFAPNLPLRIKVGYWLTPLPRAEMGNLVFIRGSHRWAHLPQYKTHETHPEQESLIVRPGTMTLMWGGLWHRVEENRGTVTRKNMFLEYGPTWIVAGDHFSCNPEWLAGLSRTRRIIMREYDHPNYQIKPPDEDTSLFLPRADEHDVDSDNYAAHVPPHLRKRTTWVERNRFA